MVRKWRISTLGRRVIVGLIISRKLWSGRNPFPMGSIWIFIWLTNRIRTIPINSNANPPTPCLIRILLNNIVVNQTIHSKTNKIRPISIIIVIKAMTIKIIKMIIIIKTTTIIRTVLCYPNNSQYSSRTN